VIEFSIQFTLLWIYKSFTGRDLPSASLRSRRLKTLERSRD